MNGTDVSRPGAPPQVVVVIVAYESGEHLDLCLQRLDAQTFRHFETIVWDNASTDDASAALAPSIRLRVVRSKENLGFAAGNNRAAALSSAPYIATLNADAFPEPDWLARLVAAADATGAQAVGSLQLADHDPTVLDGAGDCMSIAGIAWRGGYGQPRTAAPRERCEVFAPCAAAALYRRNAFETAGGFDERFFCYYEDVDLGFRLRLAGGLCVLEPAAVVRHVGSASTGKVAGFAEYHGTRNRLWAFLRDMPLVLAPITWPAHAAVIAYVLCRSGGELRKVRLRGLGDGLKGAGPFLRQARLWPRGGLTPLLRALSWSPLAISRRAPVVRRLARRGPSG